MPAPSCIFSRSASSTAGPPPTSSPRKPNDWKRIASFWCAAVISPAATVRPRPSPRRSAPRHAGTYGKAQSHTPKEVVVEAANQARDAKADLLVSIGGGSVTDTVKIMQRCLWHNFTTVEELVPNRMFGVHQVPGMDPSRHPPGMDDAIRMIAVPATYSAAEFNFGGSVLNLTTHAKEAHAHPLMIPRTVVLDPEVTLFTSLDQLLASGIYLVDHFIADFMSPKANLVSRMMIGEGIRHLPGALRAIKNNPDDLEPRLYGLLCAWWARDPDLSGVFQGLGHAHRPRLRRALPHTAGRHLGGAAAGGVALEFAGERGPATRTRRAHGSARHAARRRGCGIDRRSRAAQPAARYRRRQRTIFRRSPNAR